MAKKKKEEKEIKLEDILFNCRDYLRGSASLNDKRDVILTLVFLRFIGEKFEDAQAEIRQMCLDRGLSEDKIAKFLNSPVRYKNIVFVPEAARWSKLINVSLSGLIAALLNSVCTFLTLEFVGTSRNLGALDLNANYLKHLRLLNPDLISDSNKAEIIRAFAPLSNRTIATVFEEIKKQDRIDFDKCILRAYGINETILPSLYEMLESVYERISMKDK